MYNFISSATLPSLVLHKTQKTNVSFCQSGGTAYYYKCARDGEKKSHKKGGTANSNLRPHGTRKCGSSCPAHIVATASLGKIEARHFCLHIGHGTEKTAELKHQRLPKSTKDEITAKLQFGVSADRILSGKYTWQLQGCSEDLTNNSARTNNKGCH